MPAETIPPLLEVRCPACQTDQTVEYVMLDTPMVCTACSQAVRMARIMGSVTPNTGYAVTFGSASWLFAHSGRRAKVAAIVARTGHTLRVHGAECELVNATGTVVDPATVHRAIQSDPSLQFDFYQEWMDASRSGD